MQGRRRKGTRMKPGTRIAATTHGHTLRQQKKKINTRTAERLDEKTYVGGRHVT